MSYPSKGQPDRGPAHGPQAIFWFHPLTWWIGSRLLEERERACDEEVLHLGCKPSVYAESILTVCRLYLSSPLECVAGVTGSDLKRRIEAIMRQRSVRGLTFARKLALAGAGLAALVVPVVMGFLNAPAMRAQDDGDWQRKAGGKMAFEVASVKLDTGSFRSPNFPLDNSDAYRPVGSRFSADFPLQTYISFAYKLSLSPSQREAMLAHLPHWVATDRYAIDGRAAGTPSKDQMRLMMQSLLADRFKLSVHFETQTGSAYAMVLAKAGKTGPQLRQHSEGPPCGAMSADVPRPRDGEVFPPVCDVYMLTMHPGKMAKAGSRNTTTALLASALPGLGRFDLPVVDQTGLNGRYDFWIEWAPEPASSGPPNADARTASEGPAFIDAVREQLGLKLESTKAPLRVLVVDKVERPSEN